MRSFEPIRLSRRVLGVGNLRGLVRAWLAAVLTVIGLGGTAVALAIPPTYAIKACDSAGLPAMPGTVGCSVAGVNSSRVSASVAFVAGATSLVMTLAACGSDSDNSSKPSASTPSIAQVASSLPEAPPATAGCPTAAPTNAGTPEWTLSGTTGNVEVTGSTDTAAPYVKVGGPFSVTETQVHTLKAGDGPVVAPTATVSVCYMGVNGRDGSVFDSSYERGTPADFPLNGVVPGFQKAIAGQKVGSTVAVAMTSADGYPNGQPAAGIQPGDSLVFAIKILDAA